MVTDRQIAAIKYLIFHAKEGSPLVKRILAFLLDQSQGLTKEVYLTLESGQDYTDDEVHENAVTMNGLQSVNCQTHLNEIMSAVGAGFEFSVHYGYFDKPGHFSTLGQFAGLPGPHFNDPLGIPTRYTFWCAYRSYSYTASPVLASRSELEAIDLEKPGLYPSQEDPIWQRR